MRTATMEEAGGRDLVPSGPDDVHLVQFYDDDRYLIDSIGRFLGPGLESGAPALVIATPEHAAALEHLLLDRGIDLERHRVAGRYVALDAAEQLPKFLVDGWPDPEKFLALGGSWLDGLPAASGPVRAFGEMVALLWEEGRHEAAIRLEALWNLLAERRRFSLLCAYPMRMFRTREERDAFLEVLEAHSHVVPAESYSALVDPEERLRTVTALQQKAEALETEARQRTRAEAALRTRCNELADAHRRKDEFLAMLGHELRNPLAALRGAVEVARGGGPRAGQALELVEQNSAVLERLVNELLDVSRLTHGRISLCRETTSLNEVVSRAIQAVRPAIEKRRHWLDVTLPPEPLRIEADPMRLAQVFVNLLANACGYTLPGGTIQVLVGEEEGRAVVRVRDSGVGMSPELLARAFDLFVQAEQPLDRSDGGLGVGLTIARRLVELHGGRIEATSEGAGKGAEFRVSLPLPVRLPPETRPDAPPKAEPKGSAEVLLVEDDPSVAKTLRMVFEMYGHRVTVAPDGFRALDHLRSARPDVVFVDIGLPRMDGYEVARRIRGELALADVVLVALSGYGTPDHARRAISAGFDHFLVKPVAVEKLRSFVSQFGSDTRTERPPVP